MAKPKPNKYSRARVRSRVRRPKRAGSSRGWILASIAVALLGTLLVVLSYNDRQTSAAAAPVANQDHWHAYLGVNICGTWEPAVPQFEGRDGSMNPSPQAGIHSHGDYLIHDHPYASDESGAHATLGRYLGYAQTDISATSIKLWDQWVPGVDKKNGDTCPTLNKPGVLQWKVGTAGQPWPTEARTGNPGDWHIENGKIVAIYFLPKGAALEEPPGAEQALASVQDLGGQPAVSTTTPSSTPTSSDTGAASSSSSTPAASTSTSTP